MKSLAYQIGFSAGRAAFYSFGHCGVSPSWRERQEWDYDWSQYKAGFKAGLQAAAKE